MESVFNILSSASLDGVQMVLNGLWLGVLLTAVVWLVWRYAKRTNASTGYAIWWSVLAMVVMLPLLATGPSGYRVSSPEPEAQAMPIASSVEGISATTSRSIPTTTETPIRLKGAVGSTPNQSHAITPRNESFAATDSDYSHYLATLVRLLPISLASLWICIVLVLLVRLALACRLMIAVKSRAVPLDISGLTRVERALQSVRTRRPVRVFLSSEVDSPMAAGLGRPTVLIPARLVGEMTEADMESIILHELAHLERWDDWTKLFQRVIEALAFFNPAVYWIGRRLDLEREVACDDRVVARTGQPKEYAQCLARVAQLSTTPAMTLVPGVLTSRKQIFQRFDRLLGVRTARQIRMSGSRFLAVTTLVAAMLIVAVRVAPAIVVPLDAVTYSELQDTVSSIASMMPGDDAVEQTSSEDVDDTDVASDEGISEISQSSSLADEAESTLRAASESEQETARDRVLDWNRDLFSTCISGIIHPSDDDEEPYIVWCDGRGDLWVVSQGEIKFSSDNKDVRRVYKDAYLALREKHGSIWRELDITRGRGGKPKYTFFENGTSQEFDRKASRWMSRVFKKMGPMDLIYTPRLSRSRDLDSYRRARSAYTYSYDGDDDYSIVDIPRIPAIPSIPSLPAMPEIPEIPEIPETPLIMFGNGGSYRVIEIDDDDFPSSSYSYRISDYDDESDGFLHGIVNWAGNLLGDFSTGTNLWIDSNGKTVIKWGERGHRYEVEKRGEIEFADSDRDITAISKRGYFNLLEKRGRTKRLVEIEPDRNGELHYDYYENGKARDWDDDAREWFGEVLIEAIRVSGIGAEKRVGRIYAKGGINAVLDEIKEIDSDFTQSRYFTILLNVDDLSEDDFALVFRQAARTLDSDYEKAELLIGIVDVVNTNPNLMDDYVDAVATLDSDYETRRVLSEMSVSKDVSADVLVMILEIAGGMDSDYEKAELLIEMARYSDGESKTRTAYIEAVTDLDSDYETRRVISALGNKRKLSEESIELLLSLAVKMDSDYEKAEVLVGLAECAAENKNIRQAYLTAAETLDSDYETKRVLVELIEESDIDRELVFEVLPAIELLDSDYEKSEVLIMLVRYCRGDDELENAFVDVVETMESDYEIDQLYSKLYRRSDRSRSDR